MKILIIGAGAVGFSIAKQLSAEGHDISVVDANPKLTRKITEKLDVFVQAGRLNALDISFDKDMMRILYGSQI